MPKTVLLMFIAKKIGLLKPLLIIFVFYGMIRNFSRGIHAKTPLGCWVVGTVNYLAMAYLSVVITVPKKVYDALYICCFCVYLKYAPSGTEVNPVYKDQVVTMKIISLLLVVVYYFIGTIKTGLLRNIALLSLISQAIHIIPLTYKISNQKGGVIYEE